MEKKTAISARVRELLSLYDAANDADRAFILKFFALAAKGDESFFCEVKKRFDNGDIRGIREYIDGCAI